jgi:hypothetical protein
MAAHLVKNFPDKMKAALHWSWHALILLAVMMACMAVFIHAQSLDEQPLTKARQHLLFVGCMIMSAGSLILWLLRQIISDDWSASTLRHISPADLHIRHIGPENFPCSFEAVSRSLLVLWASWVSWSLIVDDRLAARLTLENGLLQDATVILYVIATFFFLGSLFRTVAGGTRAGLTKWWFLLLSVGCIGVAGEEINWGQSVMPYATPDFLVRTNIQQEVSLHNIELPGLGGRHWSNAALWAISLIGGVMLPLLLLFSSVARRLVVALDIPIPPWTSQAFFLVAALIPPDGTLLGRLSRDNIPSELREVTVACAMMIWGWAWWRQRRTISSDSRRHRVPNDERDEIRTLPV